MMKVYIVRHGQSINNRDKLWSGWMDIPLTEKGVTDAQKAGKVLSGVVFDKIYSSDLIRARQTLETALPGCDYETSPMLREVATGDITGKPILPFTDEELRQMSEKGYAAFGGETREEFRGRVEGFMQKLEKSEFETVAIFSHAGWLRTFLNLVIGVNLPRDSVRCKNCTVGIFEYEKGQWSLHSWINV